MYMIWKSIKGYVVGAIALIACPCHLPITFPLLLALTAGTGLGAWLSGYYWLIFGLLTIIFITGIGLVVRCMVSVQPAPTNEPRSEKK